MGREIKRVPMDFDWPVGEIWPGFCLSVCGRMEDKGCDLCKHFARLVGKGDECPDFEVQPPQGEGWQMWETVTEGSPISPVFSTPEELAHWLADTKASACGSMTATYDEWFAMIKEGWVPTMIMECGQIRSGVEDVSRRAKEKT